MSATCYGVGLREDAGFGVRYSFDSEWEDGRVVRRYWVWLVEQEQRPARFLPVPLSVQFSLAFVFEIFGVALGLLVATLGSWSLALGAVIGFVAGWIVGNVVGVAAKVAGRNQPRP